MLLLTMNEWVGPGDRYPSDQPQPAGSERIIAVATRLPFVQALERVRAYEAAYNAHYRLAVNLRLLTVCPIPETDDELLESLQVEIVEKLAQTAADFA